MREGPNPKTRRKPRNPCFESSSAAPPELPLLQPHHTAESPSSLMTRKARACGRLPQQNTKRDESRSFLAGMPFSCKRPTSKCLRARFMRFTVRKCSSCPLTHRATHFGRIRLPRLSRTQMGADLFGPRSALNSAPLHAPPAPRPSAAAALRSGLHPNGQKAKQHLRHVSNQIQSVSEMVYSEPCSCTHFWLGFSLSNIHLAGF